MESSILREAVASLCAGTLDAVILYDREGNAVFANESAQRVSGYALDEIVGEKYLSHVARRDVERVGGAIKAALAGGQDHFESHIRHRDGSIIPIECAVFPAYAGGQIVGTFAQARDIVALRSAEDSLSINQERSRSLFEYHPDSILELKDDGRISRVNVALESETGFYGEQVVGKSWTELIAPELRGAANEALRMAMRGEVTELDSCLLDLLGNRIDVQLELVPLHAQKLIAGAYAIFRNTTAQRAAERAIEAQSERIRKLYMVTAARGATIDEQIDGMLRLGLELFGFDGAFVSRFDGDRIHIRNAAGDNAVVKGAMYPMELSLSRHLSRARATLSILDLDASEWRDDAARRIIEPWRSYFAVQLDVADEVYGALVFAGNSARNEGIDKRDRDLLQLIALFVAGALERAQQNERIEQMAFTDALTELPNRLLFTDRIEHTLATAKRYDRGFAVMYCDLDYFKRINDQYGHAAGDAVLRAAAKRLREMLRESDTIARFGGDEFVILQPVVDGLSDAADLARKITLMMHDPVVIDGVAHTVHLSIGIALFPSDASTISELIEAADRALYRAKHEGRNRWCFANQGASRHELLKKKLVD